MAKVSSDAPMSEQELELCKQFGLECAISETLACKILGVDRVTLYRLRKAGKIRFTRIGTKRVVYAPSELRRFMEEGGSKPRRARQSLAANR